MARKDEILKNFLKHDLLKTKYELEETELPTTVREGLTSDKPIIKAIAVIVENLENHTPVTDAALRNQVIQLLNQEAI